MDPPASNVQSLSFDDIFLKFKELRGANIAWELYVEWTLYHRFNSRCKNGHRCLCEHFREYFKFKTQIPLESLFDFEEFRLKVHEQILYGLSSFGRDRIYEAWLSVISLLPSDESQFIRPLLDKYTNDRYDRLFANYKDLERKHSKLLKSHEDLERKDRERDRDYNDIRDRCKILKDELQHERLKSLYSEITNDRSFSRRLHIRDDVDRFLDAFP